MIGLLSSVGSSTISSDGSSLNVEPSSLSYVFAGAILVGLGFRIWELIDVWLLPSNIKVVKDTPFKIKPLIAFDEKKNLNYGLSLNYYF